MSNYVQKLISYFFHHHVSGKLTNRVYKRISSSTDEKEKEKAFLRIWKETENVVLPEEQIEEAYKKLASSLEMASVPFSSKKAKRFSWYRIAAIWLIPLGMLCSAAYFYYIGKHPTEISSEIAYVQRYAALGTRERVVLPDSSVVWLNAGSLLVYPSALFPDTRNVYLSGEAFFEVAKDEKHPFIVTTGHLQLKVLGTTFNISAYPDNSQVIATLETGVLQVDVAGQNGRYVLAPDDQLIYTPSTKTVERLKVKATDYSDWRTGGLFFNDMPLEDVLRALERVYHVKFHVYNSIGQDQILRVRFNKDEALETVLQIIRYLMPGIEYEIDGANIYLK